jgi:hypothetical protein
MRAADSYAEAAKLVGLHFLPAAVDAQYEFARGIEENGKLIVYRRPPCDV